MDSHVQIPMRAPAGRPGILAAATARKQAGVGLIEVMVAVLVLSIGFLGVAALQAHALSTNNSAMARSIGTIASYSILDAMRADLSHAKAGNYNVTVTGNACPTTTTTLANAQLAQWCSQLVNTFGQASTTKGTIDCSAAGDCEITIQFDDSRSGKGGDAAQKIVTQAML
jgi:type IV pilus assembly protein PilV